ncbi:hypothetical protein M6B38_336515 [Iris pallida]|uniref:Uncharacterized protein n=1 Tax=Iris pallida TaxID=29817 RepID=A0AAX6H0E4_IRIPA|nr:hypothetical protein M6B38_336515 [Iris pallida]
MSPLLKLHIHYFVNFHRSWPRTCLSFSKRPSICSLGEEEEDASAEVSPHYNEE